MLSDGFHVSCIISFESSIDSCGMVEKHDRDFRMTNLRVVRCWIGEQLFELEAVQWLYLGQQWFVEQYQVERL